MKRRETSHRRETPLAACRHVINTGQPWHDRVHSGDRPGKPPGTKALPGNLRLGGWRRSEVRGNHVFFFEVGRQNRFGR